jgi:hypothetical protein
MLGALPVPLSVYLPEIPKELDPDLNLLLQGGRSASLSRLI